MIENMEREGLNPIDLSRTFNEMANGFEGGMTSEAINKELKAYGISNPPSASSIRNIMRLTNLPQWAQDMIQSGQLTPKHANHLLAVKDLPNIIKETKKTITAKLKEAEPYSASDLSDDIGWHMQTNYPRARQVYVSEYTDLDAVTGSALYEPSKLKKEDKEKLNIITVDGSDFITNIEEHKNQNTIAADKIRTSRKRAEDKKKTSAAKKASGEKKEINVLPREDAFRDYVFAWLFDAISKALSNVDKSEPIFDQLIAWCAFNMPQQPCDYDEDDGCVDMAYCNRGHDVVNYRANTAHQLYSLRCFVNAKNLLNESAIDALVKRVVGTCDIEHRAFLAKHLGIDIANDFKIDDDYLKLYTKDGLLELAKEADVVDSHNPTLDKQPNPQIRDNLIESHKDKIGCPVHVLELIDSLVKDYNEMIDESLTDIAAAAEKNKQTEKAE